MKRILVVDDIAENRYLLEVMLQAYGYEVISANDGAEALASAGRQPPDLVISDILMPVLDGFALCKRWRSEPALRGIPFIFYTATYTDARDEQLAMDLGADRFVIKPQEPQVMHAIVQEVLARGMKSLAVPVALAPPADEIVTLREYNEALVRKLEKKLIELEAAREALETDVRQRHEIEAALRSSEERWRLIYDTEPECVKVVSAEGRLLSMNPAGLAMIEAHSLDEVCGKQVLDLVVPEYREAYLALHRDVLGGQSRRLVFEIIGLNGTRRWLETHEAPLKNEDGSLSLLGITRDITELKQSEGLVNGQKQVLELIASGATLTESLTALVLVVEERFSDVLCSILLLDTDGIHLRHGAAPSLPPEFKHQIDGRTIDSSAGSCGTAAFRREPVVVADIATDPLWADYRELALHHGLRACWSTPIFDAARRVLGTFAMYYRQPARPNEYQLRLIDMATHTAAIAISKHHEEAALHEAQTALRSSEERLFKLFHNSPDLVVLVSLPEGQLLDVNHQFLETTGYCRDEVLGRTTLELGLWVNPAQRDQFYQLIRERVAVRVFDATIRTKSGESLDMQFSADMIELDGRACAITSGRDVTAQKRLEQALRDKDNLLSESQRIAHIGSWLLDLTGRVVFSDETYRLFGVSPNTFMPSVEAVLAICHPEDGPVIQTWIAACLAEEQPDPFEFRRILPDGRVRFLSARGEMNYDAENRPCHMTGTVQDVTERQHAHEELSASRERLAILSRQLIAAQESERRHLARELHDEIGQALTGIKLNLKALQQPAQASQSSSLVQDTIDAVDQTLQQVRSLALDLRPSMLDDIGLVAALRWCLDRQSQRTGFAPQFVADASVSGASPEINTACFRVAQESLTNIARHANARNVRVEIRQVEGELELLVTDDGIGFDVPAARRRATRGESIGLLGMEERVQLVGGQFEIESNPSGGTTIRARFPMTTVGNDK